MRPTDISKIVLKDTTNPVMIDALQAVAPQIELAVVSEAADLDRELADAQILIGGRITEEQLALAKQLRWHHVPWVGVEGVPHEEYAKLDILLTNGSGVNAINIAEHVVAMMLCFGRDLPRFTRDQTNRKWRDWEDGSPVFFELTGQCVLCLGTGEIGQQVARKLAGFDCEMVGASRSGRQVEGFDRCVSFAEITEELAQADHIVSSLPHTADTEKIVNHEMIQSMKPGAYFHNVGRGDTVDQDALIEALQSGHLAGAGLDVTTPEPLDDDSPLWDMKNVIITSHTSGNSPKAQERMAQLAAEQLQNYLAGEDLRNVVDLTAGY